ncbi:MAG: hypothetical protein ACR5KW_02275 [Wolbachia sp.]
MTEFYTSYFGISPNAICFTLISILNFDIIYMSQYQIIVLAINADPVTSSIIINIDKVVANLSAVATTVTITKLITMPFKNKIAFYKISFLCFFERWL